MPSIPLLFALCLPLVPAEPEAPADGDLTGAPAESEAPAGGDITSAPAESEAPAGGDITSAPAESEAPAGGDITGVNLEDLLDFETDVASTTALSLRESPAIVTVITRDEITRVGARDLIDVLNLVPGMGFGVDVQGVVGIGARGLWGHEGKVLLMIDGQPMNELLYGTTQFGNHVPVELIERIEIIRGPGSAIYGGFAELAVIDVITRSAAALNGGAAAASYGRMRDTTGRWQASAGFGQRYGDLEVVGQAAIGYGIRSDRTFTDNVGNQIDMQNASDLKPGFINVGVRYRGLAVRLIYDDYRMKEQDDFGEITSPAPTNQNFHMARAETRYEWRLADTLTLTPIVSYTWQKPWNTTDISSDTFYNKTAQRVTAGANAAWQPLEELSVAVGSHVWLDRASINPDQADIAFNTTFNGANSVNYQNYIGFADVLWRTVVNVEGGARVEHHSQFGSSFVPRLALTKVLGDFHVKGLASRAFRAPVFENIATNPDIKPERTTAFEVEGGYRFSSQFFASVNLFDVTISRPITYGYNDTAGTELYTNGNKLGTRGVESVLRYAHNGDYATLGYSFYTTAGKETESTYQVPGKNDVLLAWPTHKLTLATSFAVTNWFSLGGTAIVMSRRYAIFGFDTLGAPLPGSYAPRAYLSATLFFHDFGVKGLEGSLTMHNIGDAQSPFIQPYDGGHPPLPGASRELVARLAYAF